jgi:hypothetical protein
MSDQIRPLRGFWTFLAVHHPNTTCHPRFAKLIVKTEQIGPVDHSFEAYAVLIKRINITIKGAALAFW